MTAMQNRLSQAVLAMTLVILTCGCTTNTTPSIPSTQGIPATMPDDFYIIYQEQRYVSSPYVVPPDFNAFSPDKLLTRLDTKNNTAGEIFGCYDGPTLTHHVRLYPYIVPRKDLQDIYAAIIEYDIISYCGLNVIGEDGRYPGEYYRTTFCINGEIYQITFSGYALAFPETNDILGAFLDILTWESRKGIPLLY